jgi:hypothetical protein
MRSREELAGHSPDNPMLQKHKRARRVSAPVESEEDFIDVN